MNLQSYKGTPDSLKQRFKGSERKLSLGSPDVSLVAWLSFFFFYLFFVNVALHQWEDITNPAQKQELGIDPTYYKRE